MKFNQTKHNQMFSILFATLCLGSKHKHPLRESYGEDHLDVNFCHYVIEQELEIRYKKHVTGRCVM